MDQFLSSISESQPDVTVSSEESVEVPVSEGKPYRPFQVTSLGSRSEPEGEQLPHRARETKPGPSPLGRIGFGLILVCTGPRRLRRGGTEVQINAHESRLWRRSLEGNQSSYGSLLVTVVPNKSSTPQGEKQVIDENPLANRHRVPEER